ncbi:MAG TPA: FHA domain-containing protein [Ignavibacteriaceae bacterium]|nr:FHA domain-containing protein [Ignavibacteriaceae bacterium]
MNQTQISEKQHYTPKIIKVKIEKGKSAQREYYFQNNFTVGRSEECSIQIDEGMVSRVHVEVIKENNSWWISDKNSSNGTFLNGSKIKKTKLKNAATLQLGNSGPILHFTFCESFELDAPKEKIPATDSFSVEDPSVTKYIRHYFDESGDGREIGSHTRMMREAFKLVQKKHSTKYLRIIIVIGAIALIAAGYAVYQQIKENKQKSLAENIFYDMKSLELEISGLRESLKNSGDNSLGNALSRIDSKHKQMENNYNQLVEELGIYDLNEEDRLIIQTARVFGECEILMPKDFLDEVKNYINKWKSSERLKNALERAKRNGYINIVVNYLKRMNLPEQFFYLALQESDFREQIVGPQTRYGYAKGIWQFIPQTAKKYGLNIGPLVDQNVFDPADDRYNFPKATGAAARYIKDIFSTDAQASGLLVMASYNWGENNIIGLIRSMPENPRERNFWKLLEKYHERIPEETYNYVFYIFSAAVIGENPSLFGFNFENPLKNR